MPEPSGGSTEYVNRIGLGVYTEDPDGAALSHLRSVRSEMRAILDLSRQMGSVRLPTIPQARERRTTGQAAVSEAREAARAAIQRVQTETRQLSLLDAIDRQVQENREARARHTRGVLGQSFAFEDKLNRERLAQIKRLSDAELQIRAISTGGRSQELNDEIETRRRATRLREDEATAEERAWAASRRRRSTDVSEMGRPLTFGRSPITPIDEAAADEVGATQEKWRRSFITAQQRRAAREAFELEQRLSTTPARERARQESELEVSAQEKLRRRELNERINARAAAIERQQAAEEARRQQAERPARERGVRQAIREGRELEDPQDIFYARRLLTRFQQRQKAREGFLRREQEAERAAARRLENQVQRDRASYGRFAERRDSLDLEAPLPERLRRRQQASADLAQREAAERAAREQRRSQEERNRNAAINRSFREEAEQQGQRRARREGLRQMGDVVYGPDEDELLRARRLEAQKRQAEGLRNRARTLDERPHGPGREHFLDVEATEKELNKSVDAARRLRQELDNMARRRRGTPVGDEATRLSGQLRGAQAAARSLRAELEYPASMRRTRAEIEGDLERVQARIKSVQNQLRGLREQEQEQGPAPRQTQGGNEGTIVQRIVRNMAIRAALFYAIYDLKRFTTDSVEAARVSAQTERQLEATARQAGVTVSSTLRIGEQIRLNADLSRQQAQETTGVVERFAFRAHTQGQEGRFAQAVTDLAVARGIENKNLAQTVDRLFRADRGVEDILGREPDTLYRSFAQRQLEKQVQVPDNLWVGRERPTFKPMNERISEYVGHLTEAQKGQIIWNETLKQGAEVAGEAARRHASLEGRIDAANARWADAHVAVGQFVLQLRPLNDLLDSISNRLQGLDTDKLRLLGSGPRNLITPGDVAQFTQARATSAATRANTFWASYGSTIETAAGIGALGFAAGRGAEFEGPRTITRTTTEGLKRIFEGMRKGIARVAESAGAESEANVEFLTGGVSSAGALTTGIVAVVGLLTVGITSQIRRQAEKALERSEAYAQAEGARLGQLDVARRAGTLRVYIPGVTGPEGMTQAEAFQRFNPAQMGQLAHMLQSGQAQQFIGEAPPTDVQRDIARRADRAGIPGATDVEQIEKAERTIDDFWAKVTEREEQRRQELVSAQSNALARIREATQGSFRIVDETAGQLATNNPFVKVFTDGATAAERMQQQWGWMGQRTADYFTKLELGAIQLRLTEERFRSLAAAQELVNRAEAEVDERGLSPELTRQEQAAGRVASAMARAAQELPQLQSEYRRMFHGVTPNRYDQEQTLKAQIGHLEAIRGVGAGLDQQGQREVNRIVNESVLGLTRGMSRAQIMGSPWLREAYGAANLGQQAELRAQIGDEVARAQLLANERQRTLRDARATAELRQREEQNVYGRAAREGRGTFFQGRFVGELSPQERRQLRRVSELSDQALVRITDRLSPREMGAELFQSRNEALRREAQRQVEQEAEALDAAQQGVAQRDEILAELKVLRQAVLTSGLGLAISVTNDTQARIDAEDLSQANAGVVVPLRSTPAASPYTPSFARYGRGGRKQ